MSLKQTNKPETEGKFCLSVNIFFLNEGTVLHTFLPPAEIRGHSGGTQLIIFINEIIL